MSCQLTTETTHSWGKFYELQGIKKSPKVWICTKSCKNEERVVVGGRAGNSGGCGGAYKIIEKFEAGVQRKLLIKMQERDRGTSAVRKSMKHIRLDKSDGERGL